MKIHLVFHVDLLERFRPDPIPGRTPKPLPPIVINGDDEYEVQSILKSRLFGQKKQLQYFVHWKHYNVSERTWEYASNLKHASKIVTAFHKSHPKDPGP